jgi:hypothetical protein
MAAAGSKAQLAQFLRFFDVKRDLYVSEIGHVFRDMKESRCVSRRCGLPR